MTDEPNWPHKKETKNGDKPLATRENLECLIDHLKIGIGYDVIKKQSIVEGINSLKGEEDNTVIAHLKSECGLYGLNKTVVDEQLATISQKNAINPVTEWLSTIKRTKTHDPIDELIDLLPVDNKLWAKIAFQRWLIQCVAAADGAERSVNKQALPKYESVLTFYGPQGLLKTAFMRSILPKLLDAYLKDGILLDLNIVDSKREALSAWLVELGELDSTFKRSEISQIKAFLSRSLDEIRRPYARAASHWPRQTSFFASVNEECFLRDATGNRRYLPIIVKGPLIVPDSFDSDDLRAYIWQEYLNGAQWWLTKPEEELQQKALKLHEDDSFEEMLRDEFLFDDSWRGQWLTGNKILDFIKVSRTKSSSTALGKALKKLGIIRNLSSREYPMPRTRKFMNTQN